MVNKKTNDEYQITYEIEGMCCAVEEGHIRTRLSSVPGVNRLDFNMLKRTLTIHHTLISEDLLQNSIREIGFEALPLEQSEALAGNAKQDGKKKKLMWPWLIAGGLAALASETSEWLQVGHPLLPAALALVAILLAGLETFKKGIMALIHRNLNINALMSIAVTGAIILGEWPEAAMVLVLFALAEHLEDQSLDKARNAIVGLVSLLPTEATVQAPDGSWQSMPVAKVQVKQLVRVGPGECISLDGQIVEGASSIDQAAISGESMPVEKALGDPVFAGTVNQNGEFVFRVSAHSQATLLSRIIHLVEEAQASRAPTQRFVDRFARVYTPLVCVGALLVALVPLFFAGANWQEWFYKSLVLLVIACPCALVIATPISIVSALAAAARAGLIIKGGVYLERGKKIDHFVFDKTGTLTQGRPVLTNFVAIAGQDAQRSRIIASSLAERSNHPVSRAIALAAENQDLKRVKVSAFSALPGRGIQGSIDGVPYFLGNWRPDANTVSSDDPTGALLAQLAAQGKTSLVLATGQQIVAVFGVADVARDSAVLAVDHLRAFGIQTHILSGDNQRTVDAIAQKMGISNALGNCMPQEKLNYIDQLCKTGQTVAFVGDGINDTPALAKADISFSLGRSGTGSAIETADVILMNDDLRLLPLFVRLAQKTSSVLVQNIGIALGIKAAFLALTFAGTATLWMAVFADLGASLIVIFNGLRMLKLPRSGHTYPVKASTKHSLESDQSPT